MAKYLTLLLLLGGLVSIPPVTSACLAFGELAPRANVKFDERNLISRAERLNTLKKFGIEESDFSVEIYAVDFEKDMVDVAVSYFKAHRGPLTARAQACLWEELSFVINQRLDFEAYRISRGYFWRYDGKSFYVYQGPLAFAEGKHATIVIAPDGTAYSGLCQPIVDIDHWQVRLSTLRIMKSR